MKVPKPILINTGDQESSGIQKIIDDFLIEASREYLAQDSKRNKMYLEIRIGEHSYSGNPSDNGTIYIKYKDDPIAAILETRTEFNRIKYTFFTNV